MNMGFKSSTALGPDFNTGVWYLYLKLYDASWTHAQAVTVM
jgi:hypothetical protein